MKVSFSVLIFIFLGLTATIYSGNSQDFSLNEKDEEDGNYVYQLGLSPAALLNKYPGVQLSHQIKIFDPIYFRLESAYLFSIIDQAFDGARGYRLRPSLQLKLGESNSFRAHLGIFFNYRRARAFREIETFQAGGSFIQIIDGHMDSRLRGWGLEFEFDFNKSLPNFSFSMGLGGGRITNTYSDPVLRVNRWFGGNNIVSGRNMEYFIIFYTVHYRLPIL
ncbi:MAG: hypothetical protein EA362_08680 [Saprospirales bacterium]|nr:MAG: hypothetical protein EA362_08680 [Saprospirales bacterium]